MTRLVVIGGGAAGMSAASAARRAAPGLDVTVCEAGGFAAYGMCGIPYYLGGVVRRGGEPAGLPARASSATTAASTCGCTPGSTRSTPPRTRCTSAGEGGSGPLGYDRLIVATGADPVRPPVPGLGHPRVFTIRSLDEAIELRRLLDTGVVRRAIVVGAGYIGLETAEALVEAGVEVEVVEALPRVLATVDEPIADLVQAELERHVRLRLGVRLDAVRPGHGRDPDRGGRRQRTRPPTWW